MRARSLASFVFGLGAVLTVPAAASAEGHDHDGHECMVKLEQGDSSMQTRQSVTGKNPVRVFLNKRGGRVNAGLENSSRSNSQIVWSRGLRSIDVPGYSRGEASWDRITACVKDQFRDFNVELVESRPASGSYITAMIGGRPGMLGFGSSVGGIAPYTAGVIDRATVFVFERGIHSERAICETTAHEIGHAAGLDHSRLCSDTMSYGHCGAKRFRDQEARCGEFGDRSCGSGSARQNSHERLASLVGTKRAVVPTRPPPQPPRRLPPAKRPPRDPATTRIGGGPRVAVLDGDRTQSGDSVYLVSVRAQDRDGIKGVELLWTDGRTQVNIACGRSPKHLPVRCSRRGDKYTFALHVGYGKRAYAVKVTDGKGKVSVTRARVASFF